MAKVTSRIVYEEQDKEGKKFLVPAKLTNIDSIKEDIDKILARPDITTEDDRLDFRAILIREFIYSSEENKFVHRKMLEALILEHTTFFQDMIRRLKERLPNSQNFIEEIIYVMDYHTDINPDTLLTWNKSTTNDLKIDKASIYYHGTVLSTAVNDPVAQRKSQALLDLFDDMGQILLDAPRQAVTMEDSFESKLDVLNLKLRLLDATNKAKPELEGHRGYRKFITNLLMGLFGLVPQIFNYFVTGNFWLANQSESEKQVARVVSKTGIDQPLLFDGDKISHEEDDVVLNEQQALTI